MANKPHDQTKPYQQRHLITVQMDSLSAELYAQGKLQEERPGEVEAGSRGALPMTAAQKESTW